ncbi:hypothetical protein [Cereibacter johrii]|uniref:hypothetical protein n=1 Tax=Cereibacter johrii TaxID=445629 RepID=UPI003CF2D8B5
MPLKILGTARDLRTKTPVVYCQASVSDYLTLVGKEYGNFTIQRRRETHKAYRRLKADIADGALLPSITLSVKPEIVAELIPLLDQPDELAAKLARPGQVDILDGLQRTFIMADLLEEGHSYSDEQKLLLEFWIEPNIETLIYRIIVLNAGQKPMSIRHQVELLFMSLKTSIEGQIDGLQIYTERDQTRRRRSRKFPLNFVISGYQAYITGSTELHKENIIAERMQIESALDASKEEVSEQFNSFIKYFDEYATFDDEVFRIYGRESDAQLSDPIDDSGTPQSSSSSRNIHWLATENVIVAFFGALTQYTGTIGSAQHEAKLERLNQSLKRLGFMLNVSPAGSDPLCLDVFDRLRMGANPRRVNVGAATRKLLANGFKEFFRSGGEIPFDQAWQLAAD